LHGVLAPGGEIVLLRVLPLKRQPTCSKTRKPSALRRDDRCRPPRIDFTRGDCGRRFDEGRASTRPDHAGGTRARYGPDRHGDARPNWPGWVGGRQRGNRNTGAGNGAATTAAPCFVGLVRTGRGQRCMPPVELPPGVGSVKRCERIMNSTTLEAILRGRTRRSRMTPDPLSSTSRIYAELPSGGYFVPGEPGNCSGPTALGSCPLSQSSRERPCAGAVWCSDGAHAWRFLFRSEPAVCPVALFDPLGPVSTPLD
jgi:hypothetical protein